MPAIDLDDDEPLPEAASGIQATGGPVRDTEPADDDAPCPSQPLGLVTRVNPSCVPTPSPTVQPPGAFAPPTAFTGGSVSGESHESVAPDVTRVGPNMPMGTTSAGESSSAFPSGPAPSMPGVGRTSLPQALADLGFPDPQAGMPSQSGSSMASGFQTAPGTARWVAEIWVDQQWYADQDADDPCPRDPGGPTVVPLTSDTVLIGRRSVSRNIHPTLECGQDTGVSRRHAQLSTDGRTWWVEDLESANGTYVGSPGEPLPLDPLEPGERHEIDRNTYIYLGAWTRISLRPIGDV